MAYAMASGHNVALGSLTDMAEFVAPYVYGIYLPPRSPELDFYPVRKIPISTRTKGGGSISHIWQYDALPVAAFEDMLSTFATPGIANPVTINTPIHTEQDYRRFNAYLDYPQANVDFTYTSYFIVNIVLRFSGLVELV